MAEISNPVLNRAINEEVRPMAERARNLLIQAQANAPLFTALLTELAAADDADVLVDGRLDVRPITVGQFRACTSLLADLVAQINEDPRLVAVLASCVRGININ